MRIWQPQEIHCTCDNDSSYIISTTSYYAGSNENIKLHHTDPAIP